MAADIEWLAFDCLPPRVRAHLARSHGNRPEAEILLALLRDGDTEAELIQLIDDCDAHDEAHPKSHPPDPA